MRSSRLETASLLMALLWPSGFASAETVAPTETRRVALDYAPNFAELGCPAPSELKAAVAARLGYDPFIEPEAAEGADQARVTIQK